MFWTGQDPKCGPVSLTSFRNTETNANISPYNVSGTITLVFTTQPTCGTTGTITAEVARGYEYEYTLSCTGRQWTGKVTVDCGNDCIPIQLK